MRQIKKQIQWFPGHMNKTRRLIEEQLGRIDVVVEILDARIPFSSRNPLLEEIITDKPLLLVLNKSDLADSDQTKAWKMHFKNMGAEVVEVTSTIPKSVGGILRLCRNMVEEKNNKNDKKINVMIAGIPNVGKSTIINSLKKQKKASVQNKPGHTRDFQRIVISNTLTLIDTPGILWHRFEPEVGYRLAVMGSIKDSILDMNILAVAAIIMLNSSYPKRLPDRYGFDPEKLPEQPEQILEMIGRKRGMLKKGGVVDYDRACEVLVHEIREGKLGPMTLEHIDAKNSSFADDMIKYL